MGNILYPIILYFISANGLLIRFLLTSICRVMLRRSIDIKTLVISFIHTVNESIDWTYQLPTGWRSQIQQLPGPFRIPNIFLLHFANRVS